MNSAIISLMKIFKVLFFSLLLTALSFGFVLAQNETADELMEGEVLQILDEGNEMVFEEQLDFQELEVLLNRGSLAGTKLKIGNKAELGDSQGVHYQDYEVGDQLRIYSGFNFEGERQFLIEGLVKRRALLSLLIVFILAVLLIGRKWGFLSLLSLVVSFLIIFKISIPLMMDGFNPLMVAVLSALLIIPSTFYLAHGFNKKTTAAVIATTVSLIITSFLAIYFVDRAHLTGYSSEEAAFVNLISGGKVNILSLVLAGLIISTLGILDDISIGQASVVKELAKAQPGLEKIDLFWQGMKVGQDHISSMVNTLILVYAGSALPLLMLFFDANKSFIDVVELEIVAEEIVKMLVSSIGLIIAAPLATALAVFFFKNKKTSKTN